MIYKLIRIILLSGIRLILTVFFRRIEVANVENVPEDVPVIFTPNHTNSLIDGLLALLYLPRDPRALAGAQLWKNPLASPLVIALNCIPVYRQQNAKNTDKPLDNNSMFKDSSMALAKKNTILVFPEGFSHDKPELQPLKTGAARIAIEAEQQHGPLSVKIVPVGLNFDAKQKFRSRVLIYFGEPIDAIPENSTPDPSDRESVNELTSRIEEGIKSVTLNYPSWREANLIKRAAHLYASHKNIENPKQSLADKFPIQKQLADAYPTMKEHYPRKVEKVIAAVKSYDRLLNALSIKHEHFIKKQTKYIKKASIIKRFSLFLVRLPLSFIGFLLNALPFYLTRWISLLKIPTHRKSTVKLFSAVIAFPLFWTLQANFLGQGHLPPLFWWLLAPASGIATILLVERHTRIQEELRSFTLLRKQEDIEVELKERLENIETEVTEFIIIAENMERKKLDPNN